MDLMQLMEIRKAEENLKLLQQAVEYLDMAFYPPAEEPCVGYINAALTSISKLNNI